MSNSSIATKLASEDNLLSGEELVAQYIRWIKDRTKFKKVSEYLEFTTPYIDRHNDFLQLYVKPDTGGYYLTDGGYIMDDLEVSGCPIDTPHRKELLGITLRGFGIQENHGELFVRSSKDEFPSRKHDLVQAMLAVNDLFYLSSPTVQSIFLEDVSGWLDEHNIRYTPRVSIRGKTGYHHNFDFVVSKSKNAPERTIQTINHPRRDATEAAAFKWLDIAQMRPENAIAYALLNDRDKTPNSSVLDALKSYNVQPILWSEREGFVELLAA